MSHERESEKRAEAAYRAWRAKCEEVYGKDNGPVPWEDLRESHFETVAWYEMIASVETAAYERGVQAEQERWSEKFRQALREGPSGRPLKRAAPDVTPPELADFAAREYKRVNRPATRCQGCAGIGTVPWPHGGRESCRQCGGTGKVPDRSKSAGDGAGLVTSAGEANGAKIAEAERIAEARASGEVERQTAADKDWIAVAAESNRAIDTFARELYPGLEAAYGMPVDGLRRAVGHALAAAKERIVELEMQQAGIDATLHAGSLVIHVIENIVEEVAKWHEARQAEWDKTLDEARANGAPLADTLIAECYGRMHQESAAALRSGEWKKETK